MDDRIKDLSKYRLEQAEKCIKSAQALVDIDDYKGSANRAYYAIFHCIRSVLALDEVDKFLIYLAGHQYINKD